MLIFNRSPYECNAAANFDVFIDQLLQICTIDGRVNPLDSNYFYVEPIGVGAQASVDIYTESKIAKGRNRRKHRAVKTYKRFTQEMYAAAGDMLTPDQIAQCSQEWQIRNEIMFLRQMRECRNIIRLREVYETDNNVQLIMSYADLGTLKSF